MNRLASRAALLLAATVIVSGQTQPAFRVTTRLVQVNVIVTDKTGPVEGLSKDDFVLYDNGKRQSIAVFEPHNRRVEQAARPAQPLAPNEFTNQYSRSGADTANAVLIVWDMLNTPFVDQMWARQGVLKSLAVIRPGDQVGIYILGSQFSVLQDFTNDSSQLRETVDKYTKFPDLFGSDNGYIFGGLDTVRDMRADRTKQAIWEIRSRLARIPGRKSVIWVSSTPPQGMYGADVSLYIVDARGLQGLPGIRAENSAAPASPVPGLPTATSLLVDSQNAMRRLAASTGGTAFVNSNDIRGSIDKAVADGDLTYTLGFYTEGSEKETKPTHDLKIETKRRGTDVRYPKAYQVSPFSPPPEQLLAIAAETSLDFTQLGVTARLENDGGVLRVPISVGSDGILLRDAGGHWAGELDFLIIQRSADGAALDQLSRSVSMNQDTAKHEAFLKEGVHATLTLEPKPGLSEIKLVVLDRNSTRVGSLSVPIKP